MIAITELICDSSHWGSNWTSKAQPPDDDAAVRTTVGEIVDALVHDVGDVQSLLLAGRLARRTHRPGFARDPRRHRLVLKSSRGYPFGALVLAARLVMEQGYFR
jgi:hypothetical protein